MANLARVSLGMAAAVTLAACAAGAVDTPYLSTWDPYTVNYIAAKGPVYTKIVGNPFEGSQEALERSVTGAMTGSNAGQPLRFSTQEDPNNVSPYRLVVLFGAEKGFGPARLCEADAKQIEQADGPVRVIATLCAGDTRESSVTARLAPTAAGPDDPAFRSLVRQMARALFPSKNDNILGNSSAFDL